MKNIFIIFIVLIYISKVFASGSSAPSSEVLEERLYAVHVTDTFPKSNVMIAGKKNGNPISLEFGDIRPDPRATLHWTIGTTFPDDEDDTLKLGQAKFAILVPLRLLNDLISISVPEAITLGNFTLTEGCFIVTPTDCHVSSRARIISYDKREKSLKKVVMEHLRTCTPWTVNLSHCNYDAIATIEESHVNINTPDFFKYFLSARNISFGINTYTNEGSSNKLGFIDSGVRWLTNILLLEEEKLDTSLLEILAIMVKWYIPKTEEYVRAQEFSHDAQTIFFEKMKHSSKWLNIIDAEIMLRKAMPPKTLKGASVGHFKQLWSLESKEEIYDAAASRFSLSPYEDPATRSSHDWFAAFSLGFLSLKTDDRNSLVDEIGMRSTLPLSTLKVYSALTRLIHLARPLSSEPPTDRSDLLLTIEQNFSSVPNDGLSPLLIGCASSELTARTFKFPPNITLIEEIFRTTCIKDNLTRLFPDELPDYERYLIGELEYLKKWGEES